MYFEVCLLLLYYFIYVYIKENHWQRAPVPYSTVDDFCFMIFSGILGYNYYFIAHIQALYCSNQMSKNPFCYQNI